MKSFRYLTAEGFKNIWVNRLMTVASVGVLVACMLLMGVAVLLSANIDRMFYDVQDQNVVMVFFKEETKRDAALASTEIIKNIDNVKNVKFITKEEAAESQKEIVQSDYEEIFRVIDLSEYLLDSVSVSFSDPEKYAQAVDEIKKIENVKVVRDDRSFAQTLVGIKRITDVAGYGIIGLLLITALVIIANTVRITMNSRKLQISIMKAVGATNNFIRFPFVVEGMLLGVISAFVTWGILYFIYQLTMSVVDKIEYFTVNWIGFSAIGFNILFLFLAVGIITGCIGSAFSLGKYLKKEGSEFRAY